MFGVPPQSRADYAFIQHIIASLSENGRCAILLPHGVLNRKEEADIRKKIVEADLIETVIGLGRHLFYNSGLESCILICNKNKKPNQKGKIRFIEAEKYQYKDKGQSYLSEKDIATIMNAYNSVVDIPELLKIASVEDVLANNGNLNIKLYVCPDESTKSKDVFIQETLDGISDSFSNSKNIWKTVNELFPDVLRSHIPENLDTQFPDWEFDKWAKVKLSDIATEYSERIDNPSESNYEWYIGSDCIDGFDFHIARKTPASKITSAQKAFKEGDYLLVRRSLYGSDFRERAPRATFDGVCSADILTIREIPGKVYDGYLIAVLYSKSLWNFIVSNSTGSLTRRIKWSQLKDFEIMLPPMHIQEKIAKMLWALYDLKSSYQSLLDKTDELVKSQFIELFGDPESNSLSLPISTLNKIGENLDSKRIPITGGDRKQGIYPYYGASGIVDYVDDYIFDEDILLISEDGANLTARVTPIAFSASGKVWVNNHAHVMRFESRATQCYIENLINILDVSNYVTGTAQPKLNQAKLNSIPIPVPELSQQETYYQFVKQTDKSKFEIKKAIENTSALIKSLMQQDLTN
jgi:restriction endonuclease S subunit